MRQTRHPALADRDVLLLDMHGTFMFGHDRFGLDEDYAETYHRLGGRRPAAEVGRLITAAWDHLAPLYDDPDHRERFPSLAEALVAAGGGPVGDDAELDRLVTTFARHERGRVPPAHAGALHRLAADHRLALVSDVWAPKGPWLDELRRAGVLDLFAATWFSSDHGVVKPSPRPFLALVDQLDADPARTVVVGDSPERDLAGATAAGLACILVGGARHREAAAHADSLLDLVSPTAPTAPSTTRPVPRSATSDPVPS